MQRSVRGEVIMLNVDEPATRHVQVAEMVIESQALWSSTAGRRGSLALIRITRLARALTTRCALSGKVMFQGRRPISTHCMRRSGSSARARNIEEGGSLPSLRRR